MSRRASKVLVKRLVEAVPRLRGVYEEHLADNDELLPHVFFAEMTRFLVGQVAGGTAVGRRDVERVIKILEEAFGAGDVEVDSLIALSFVEALEPRERGYQEIRLMMGPKLKTELKRYEKG